jgi:signal transduction protein with GAF and PtsI domain
MAAKRGNSEPGPASSMDPDDDQRLSVELLMSQLVEQASLIMTAHERVPPPAHSNRSIVQELSLPAVLRRIVETARDIAGARYAALRVIGADGLLEQFLNVGMDEEAVRAIGELPKGRGLIGALIEDPMPIRLTRIADGPRSSGFPDGHPPMTTFLGVPIRGRDSLIGNLHLTDRTDGGPFTAEDEELLCQWDFGAT